jgi:ABC-type multidrug transport system fused ATPase/permease subunit
MGTTLRLLRFARKYWIRMIVALGCLIAASVFSLVVPRLIGQGIDSVINTGGASQLIIAAGLIIGASVLRGLTNYGSRYLSEVTSQKIAYDIRDALYDHLQRLSFVFYDKNQTGQLMSRATIDVEAVRRFFAMGFLNLLQTVFLITGVAYLLLTLDWRLALLTLSFFPFIAWRAIAMSTRLRPIWLRVQQLIAALGTRLQEGIMGIRVVKAFAQEEAEEKRFAADSQNLLEAQVAAARQVAIDMPRMVFLFALPTVAVVWYGGRLVIEGSLTIGGMTQFILYLGMLGMPIRRLGFIANTLSRMMSAGARILEILDTESMVRDRPGALALGRLRGQVDFEDVSFGYGNTTALKNVTFHVPPGQLVALLGGSGSGKSTIASLISRFYDVTGGRILVDGTDIRDVTLASLRKNVGIAQQDVFLFSASIRYNIAYGVPEATPEQIMAAARAAQIHEFIQGLPAGYDTWVGERGVTLSGGEKQRLVIARALLMNPSILILDDATSSVDAETERLIRLALERLIKGRTTFIITHRLPIIRNADLILMLQDGAVVEQGKHDELMARESLYRQIYRSQLAATEKGATGVKEA